MKKCNACHQEKELSEFRKDSRIKDGHQGRCKKCVSAKIKDAYQSKYKDKVSARSKRYRDDNRTKLIEYFKDKKCIHCGETNSVVFEFHHIDPKQKDFAVGTSRTLNWNSILTEIKKCVILCANCHRIEHYRLRNK